ncbi:MAG: 50S ribosomal protein L11 methyltransferase [Prevotellaceae bacterium]|jgi:ribosomal protein L11 methyltransferase|nr:50S ribosomal protein L11 methyltransferase [Prevotellaceae bacterium]
MDYLEFLFYYDTENAFIGDLLAVELAEIDFESFVDDENGLKAYIPVEKWNEEALKEKLDVFPFASGISCSQTFVQGQNWNEEWEKNYFQPIVIGGDCVIHSTFHKDIPKAKYDIVIDPKMSFGTGHHETTSLMIEEILKADLTGKSLLDMGCGTAVLAILAAKRGADPVLAIDIEEWAYNNSLENTAMNGESQIEVQRGDAGLLDGNFFDVILANINRNILLEDMHKYAACMKPGAELYMSGFYREDVPVIDEEAKKHNLQQLSVNEKNRWVAVKYRKN